MKDNVITSAYNVRKYAGNYRVSSGRRGLFFHEMIKKRLAKNVKISQLIFCVFICANDWIVSKSGDGSAAVGGNRA